MSTSNIRINNRVASTLEVGNSLVDRAYYGSSPVFSLSDPDADAYIALVESADDDDLDVGVKVAITNFVVSCKSDGIWDAIKASCILAGARTLNGALVPLAGDAPTNFNFVSDDYDRVTGLKGDGSTKYLNSNRLGTDDPLNDVHMSVFAHDLPVSGGRGIIGHGANTAATHIGTIQDTQSIIAFARSRATSARDINIPVEYAGFFGNSRANSTEFNFRVDGSTEVFGVGSSNSLSQSNLVFGRDEEAQSSARVQFYSIGEAVDLAALDSRVTTLMNNITFAVNTGLNPLEYDSDTVKYINAGYEAGGTLA